MNRFVVTALLSLSCVNAFAQEQYEPSSEPTPAKAGVGTMQTNSQQESESSERQWHVGPTMGFGFLDLVRLGIEARINPSLGVGVSYGFIPTITILSAKMKASSVKAHAQWYPFAGSFFVGGAVGTQTISASKKETFDGVITVPTGAEGDVQIDVSSTFITPMLGWNWGSADGGLIVGMDLGVQIPMSNKTDFDADISPAAYEANVKATQDYKDAEKDVKDVGDKIGKQIIPHITFLRLGWLF